MESDERYRLAKRRVHVLKGFYIHLATYIAVMALLLLIDFLTGGGWWFYWPLLGWGNWDCCPCIYCVRNRGVSRFRLGGEKDQRFDEQDA